MIHNISRFIAALAIILLTAQTAGATETSTITVGGTDYTLFTGFTATNGNGTGYANLVDGNTSTDWSAEITRSGEPNPDPDAPPALTGDFAGGTDDPAFVEFHADEPIVPKGYVLTCYHENAGFWKPVEWALKAKLNEGDTWTTIHSSNTTLGQGKTFQIPCTNDGNNEYQYFRFEVYEVGEKDIVDLDELQFYGSLPAYTHLTVKAATCMATGIKQDCYRRNSDGKYFTDNTGTTELQESDVIAPIIPHTGEHHEATDVNIEYWQCSMCGKYFSDSGYTTEITEEQTKLYRTITIDGSISGLVTSNASQALAGETVSLSVSDLIDASTLKVNNGAVELTAKNDIRYSFTMPAADVTVTAEVAQSNADGDILTGSVRHTVTITNGANITLNNATITGSIVCEGSATITLVGTNSVSGAMFKAGIQIGGSGTTLTINGDGTLTANGGDNSAGIGLSRAWKVDATGGDIVIEGGNITANGDELGAGIGTGVIYGNGSAKTARIGDITIKGGSVKATGGSEADGIGTGHTYGGCTNTIGTVTIYDGIDKVDASSIKDFASVVYMHGETNVTASKTDYFTIIENGNHRHIIQKLVIAEIPDQTYTGSAITPEPTVTIGSLSLTKGTDYVYSYTNNTNVGTATVTVTFQGDYESLGSVEKEFTIVWSETDTDEYTIHNAAEWNVFCDCLNDTYTYNRFSGKTVRLDADITVTRMAGGDSHDFTGTFDGGGHTLTVSISSSDSYAAPFRDIMGATIRNLKVSGTVSGHKHSAGLVSYARGADSSVENTIENCLVATDVSTIVDTDGDCYLGGIVGHGFNCKLTIRGCAFTGSLTSPHNYTGGLQGWSDGNTLILEDDIFAATSVNAANVGFHPIAIHANNKTTTATVSNVYYTVAPTCTAATRIAAAGKQAHTVSAGDNVTIEAIALTGTATQYTVSGITAYSGGGLQRGQTLYYGIDDQLSLTLTTSAQCDQAGYQYAYTASAGTLSGTTLTMPDEDVTISVNTAALAPIDWATVNQGNSVDDPYMIYNKDQLLLLAHRVNGTNGETAVNNGYQGKFFKLGADITFDHPVAEPDDYDENYEAIGGYYNSTNHYFRGTFDGDDYTVSGIRIRKTGSGNADSYQGLFGLIYNGANIHDVHLTDASIKGYGRVGGIVGGMDVAFNGSGVTVSGCSVTDSYITATSSSYGIICGSNTNGYSDGTLANNYYHGCTVNGTAVTSGKGCGSGNKVIGFSIADITANHGALPAYHLDLGANITTPPGTFAGQTEWLDTPPVDARLAPENGFTLAGNHYFASGYVFTPGSTLASGAAQGYTPRAILGGQLLDLYTPTGDADLLAGKAIARLTITADCDGKTLDAAIRSDGLQHDVSYMTADGTAQTAQAVALDGTEKKLAAGWYFVGQPTVAFDHILKLGGDVNLILVDGKTMKVRITKERDCISAEGHSLHIYGQTEGTGALNAQTKGKLVVVIRITNGTLGIHGGNVKAYAESTVNTESAIHVERATAGDALVIDRGTLTANSKNSCGIYIEGGDVRINGGQVTATGAESGIDISDNEDVDDESLSIPGILTLSGGTLTASSFDTSSGESWAGTLAIAPGLTYTDGTGLYDSTTETATLAALGGKTLQPCLVLNEADGVTPLVGQTNKLVAFARTFSANVASTVCLPFAISAEQATAAGKFYTFAGVNTSGSDWVVTMQETDPSNRVSGELAANTPYLFMPSSSSEVIFSGTIGNVADTYTAGTTTSGDWTYKGTYGTIEWTTDPVNIYGFASGQAYGNSGDQTEAGKFIRVHTGGIRPFRAYLQYSGAGNARALTRSANDGLPETMTVRLIGSNGQTTAIGTLDTRTGDVTFGDEWYTLDGRRLPAKPTAKGLYINKGNKVFIK